MTHRTGCVTALALLVLTGACGHEASEASHPASTTTTRTATASADRAAASTSTTAHGPKRAPRTTTATAVQPGTNGAPRQWEVTAAGERRYDEQGTQSGPVAGPVAGGGDVEVQQDAGGPTQVIWRNTPSGTWTLEFKVGPDGVIRGSMFFPAC